MRKGLLLVFALFLLSILATACKNDKKDQEPQDFEPTATSAPNPITGEIPSPIITPTASPTPIPTSTPTPTPTPLPTPTPIPYDGPLQGIMSKEDYPRVDGSTATIPLSEAVYCLATGATPEEAANDIVHTKTTNAYYRLANQEVDLLIVYAASEEVLEQIAGFGQKLNIKPIGKDALVFMANTSNPVESLTHDQLVDIYSGIITNWAEVGGTKEELLAFQRPENSGSQNLMLKLVMKDTPMVKGPNVMTFETMDSILEAMADYSNEGNTLGYSVFYYAKNMYQLPELKFMKVNGIAPSLETIYDNSYPYINEFYAVIREDEPVGSNTRKIFDWLTGEEGQALVTELGYVPVKKAGDAESIGTKDLKKHPLPENHYYIATSYSYFGEGEQRGNVTIYNQNWDKVRVFQNAYTREEGLVSKDDKLILGQYLYQKGSGYEFRYSLYDISEDSFILSADYYDMSVLDEEKGYYIVCDSEGYSIINEKGKALMTGLETEYYNLGGRKQGENYHLHSTLYYEPGPIVHYMIDSKFNLIKKYETCDFDQVSISDENGKLLIDNDIFLKKFGFQEDPNTSLYVYNYREYDSLLSLEYNYEIMILDKKLNVIARRNRLDGENTYRYYLYHDIFGEEGYDKDWNIIHGVFYNSKGKPITDQNGKTYGNIVAATYEEGLRDGSYEQILYQTDGNKLRIYHYNKKSYAELDIGNYLNVEVNYCKGDIIVVSYGPDGGRKTRIYKKDTLLAELDAEYRCYYPDYLRGEMEGYILMERFGLGRGRYYVLLDQNGNILYQSEQDEILISVDKDLIQLERGNYIGVIDFDGNYIIKEIKNELIQD